MIEGLKRPERRVMIGRNIILTMGALYAFRQAAYYATIPPESLSGAQEIITADGHALGAWSALWGVVAILCVVDMVNRHTRQGLSLLAGVALGWGIGYLLIWAFDGFQDFALVNSAIGWLAPSVFIFGFVAKVSALQDMITELQGTRRTEGN
jgi:hypothetical protein